jgi:hypothetical protein
MAIMSRHGSMTTLSRRSALQVAAGASLALTQGSSAIAQGVAANAAAAKLSPDEQQAIALDAYLYLYPLVIMDLTRLQITNLPPGQVGGAPANAFSHVRQFPPGDLRVVVRPNFDTLYSSAWLDLTKGPVIVSAPDTAGRFYLLPMLDMWTDVFAVPGKRASGTKPGDFAIVPPRWNGRLPRGVARIDAPTPQVWIIGRTQTNGPADYPAVHKVQDGLRLTALADWGKPPRRIEQKIDPKVDTKTEPLKLVGEMPGARFFAYASELMKLHPPHLSDWSMLARIRQIGIEPGKSFDASKLDPAIAAAVPATALKLMREKWPVMDPIINGWRMTLATGVFGNNYLKRAITAMAGLGINAPEDAIYPALIRDADGNPLTGEGSYLLRFEKDQIPPVSAFWSLTLYDQEGFQVPNALNRFAIGDRDKLEFGPDGALELYVQSASPGADKETNWLPSPKSGRISLTLRCYGPKQQALDGTWSPPPVKRTA